MKLTPFAKLFITLVILGVSATSSGTTKAERSASGRSAGATARDGAAARPSPSDDFDALKNAPPDPDRRNAGSTGVSSARRSPASASSARPLVVGINTWAGHAPGIVSNGGLDPSAALASTSRSTAST